LAPQLGPGQLEQLAARQQSLVAEDDGRVTGRMAGIGLAQQVLRVALVTPLVYGLAVWMGASLPFVAAMLFATFTLKMQAPPPFAVVVVLALLLALLPLAFAGIAGVLSQYPYLMVGFVGLVLFHAFRLQAAPKTALVGVLLQTFAIMLPIATGQSEQAGGALSGAFALNGVLGQQFFGWDTHQSNFEAVEKLSEVLDGGWATLLEDLKLRGLLESTLVIWMGEFGRTPRINTQNGTQTGTMQPGRDHWPRAMSMLVSGGGMRTCQVIGATNSKGEEPMERPLTPNDLWATLSRTLGVDF